MIDSHSNLLSFGLVSKKKLYIDSLLVLIALHQVAGLNTWICPCTHFPLTGKTM